MSGAWRPGDEPGTWEIGNVSRYVKLNRGLGRAEVAKSAPERSVEIVRVGVGLGLESQTVSELVAHIAWKLRDDAAHLRAEASKQDALADLVEASEDDLTSKVG